jgi:hypothetical protein
MMTVVTAGELLKYLATVPEDCEEQVSIDGIEGNQVMNFINLVPTGDKTIVLIAEGSKLMKHGQGGCRIGHSQSSHKQLTGQEIPPTESDRNHRAAHNRASGPLKVARRGRQAVSTPAFNSCDRQRVWSLSSRHRPTGIV